MYTQIIISISEEEIYKRGYIIGTKMNFDEDIRIFFKPLVLTDYYEEYYTIKHFINTDTYVLYDNLTKEEKIIRCLSEIP